MTLKERIQNLCKENKIPVSKLESDLGFGGGYVSKMDKSTPTTAKIQSIAKYLNVSIDYLLMVRIIAFQRKTHILWQKSEMMQN